MAASTKFSLGNISDALKSLTIEQTKELVVHFGVTLSVTTDVEYQYGKSCPKMHLLQAWVERDTEASWEKIATRLKEIGKDVLAKDITTQYCPKLSTDASSADTTKSTSEKSLQPTSIPSLGAPTNPIPAGSHAQPPAVTECISDSVMATIANLEKRFSNIVSSTRSAMCKKETCDSNFLDELRDYLFNMSIAKKKTYVKFFRESEDDILDAKSIRKIFAILARDWDYSNYEILQEIIFWFHDDSLKISMKEYCKILEEFERSTLVDTYLSAKSAGKSERAKFTKMVVKIEKPSSECTLYDIRKKKEEFAEAALVTHYSVYIESVSVGCVEVVFSFPPSAVGFIMAAMTPHFMGTHHLTEVTVDGKCLTTIQAERQLLVCVLHFSIKFKDLVMVW